MAALLPPRPDNRIPSISFLPAASLLALALLFLLPSQARAGAALTATAGANSRDHFKGGHMAFSGSIYLKWDEMVLIGAQSGVGSVAGPSSIPILGSAIMRLPFGRVVLPFAAGEAGYVLDDENDGFLWRGGGGFDIKNGRHSSILLLGGFESASGLAGWYVRGGLLLEY